MPELVAAQQVVVEEGRAQVVGRGDGVDVAGEVEVDVLHRQHLAVAATGAAALDAEDRSQGGLPDGHRGAHADAVEPLGQPDRGGGLALAERRRRDGRDDDLPAVRPVGQTIEDLEADLGLVAAVQLDLVGQEPQLGGDVGDRTQRGVLGDLEGCWACASGCHAARPLRAALRQPAVGPSASCMRAARARWRMSTALVTGPTPPGTGVMAPATGSTEARSTSPTIVPSARTLMPQSMTVAPGWMALAGDEPGDTGGHDDDLRPPRSARRGPWSCGGRP